MAVVQGVGARFLRAITTRDVAMGGFILLAAIVPLAHVMAASQVPASWPATGLGAGWCLRVAPDLRRPRLIAFFVLMLLAHLVSGYSILIALGFSVSCTLAVAVVCALLWRGGRSSTPSLVNEGDVSSLVGSITAAALVAALGYAGTDQLVGHGRPVLALVAAFGGQAAGLMVLLPLFLETPRFAALASPRERVVQFVLTVGTTVLVFKSGHEPPIVFAVMPMFAWYAFRGTLREATILLTLVGLIGGVLTDLQYGSIWALGARYGLAPELAGAVLSLFLLDCGLILLPLSVMATQQRMSAAHAAAERETLERLVAAATGTAVIATDLAGRIALFNPGAEAMLGYSCDEALGEFPDRFHTAEHLREQAASFKVRPVFSEIARASVEDGVGAKLWRFVRRDGEERFMTMTVTAIPDAGGAIAGYLATGEDVTEREQAHRALLATLEHQQAAVERLQELERVKGEFVSTVSHELRTPITSIIGYLELLGEGAVGDLSSDQQELVTRVERNGRRLLLLVEDLLMLSQIEEAALRIEPVLVDLRTIATHAMEGVAGPLRARDLSTSLHLPGEPVEYDGDPAQLERMVSNLVANAVKFTPDGGHVGLWLEADDEEVQFGVLDTGMGIPEHEQDKLFTRFFRSAVATERAIQGTGLGLSIAKAIVTLHGGQIRIRSRLDEGTKVTVTLPRSGQAHSPHTLAPFVVDEAPPTRSVA